MKEEPPLKIFIVAGEASGDLHGAPLMRAIRDVSRRPVVFRGIGGDAMKEEGLEQLVHCDSIAVIGIWEVVRRIRFFAHLLNRMEEEIEDWKPDLLLTIDYPGFNLSLAGRAKKAGIRTVHYICPQVWIWRRNRIWKIARVLDQLITIFPFEPACFTPTKLRPVYAGHPLVDRARETLDAPQQDLPWLGSSRRVALLPGSRPSEIANLLPDMVAAAASLESQLDTPCSFIIPAATDAIRQQINAVLDDLPRKPSHLSITDGQAREVLRQAEAAAVASGTATLEASLMLCPTVLVYRTTWFTYRFGRIVLRKAGGIGLANLIMRKPIMPELIQQDFTPDRLADQLHLYLTNQDEREKALAGLREVNATLGSGNAAERAAHAILDAIPDGVA